MRLQQLPAFGRMYQLLATDVVRNPEACDLWAAELVWRRAGRCRRHGKRPVRPGSHGHGGGRAAAAARRLQAPVERGRYCPGARASHITSRYLPSLDEWQRLHDAFECPWNEDDIIQVCSNGGRMLVLINPVDGQLEHLLLKNFSLHLTLHNCSRAPSSCSRNLSTGRIKALYDVLHQGLFIDA